MLSSATLLTLLSFLLSSQFQQGTASFSSTRLLDQIGFLACWGVSARQDGFLLHTPRHLKNTNIVSWRSRRRRRFKMLLILKNELPLAVVAQLVWHSIPFRHTHTNAVGPKTSLALFAGHRLLQQKIWLDQHQCLEFVPNMHVGRRLCLRCLHHYPLLGVRCPGN